MDTFLSTEIQALQEDLIITNKFLNLLLTKKYKYDTLKHTFNKWRWYSSIFCPYPKY